LTISDPAPKFDVICKPNEWAKVVKHSSEHKGLGETDLKKLDFWTKLESYAADKKVANTSGDARYARPASVIGGDPNLA
jgi:hypothetical protein